MAKAIKLSLSKGRPPLLGKDHAKTVQNAGVNARRKSAKATRALINTHHQLHKQRALALSTGDLGSAKSIDDEIERLGGLSAYQAASLTGQDKDRGGDSSVKLIEWLRKYGVIRSSNVMSDERAVRVLEVGALSSDNAISLAIGNGVESVKRIDLHSQDIKNIEEIDFMDLPIPSGEHDKFDVLSLSLVLNYVPDAGQRGDMLLRTCKFLRKTPSDTITMQNDGTSTTQASEAILPCLFVVLPLPCMENSRYMTHEHFLNIMQTIGYRMIEHHDSQKLCYMLFKLGMRPFSEQNGVQAFKKSELRSGRNRNNFAILLEPR